VPGLEKPVETIGSLFLRLVTIRYRRRRDRFTEIIAPIHQEFLAVHAHYYALLDKYEALLPYHRRVTDRAIEWTVSEAGEIRRLTRSEEQIVLSSILAEVKGASQTTAPIRRLFRTRVGDLLESVSHEPERRYLIALLAYFGNTVHTDVNDWHFKAGSPISATIDRLLEDAITARAFAKLTESTSIGESLEDLLLESPEYEFPRRYASATRQWIDEAFVQVGREFQKANLLVLQDTTI
jgi:hypothetical protein